MPTLVVHVHSVRTVGVVPEETHFKTALKQHAYVHTMLVIVANLTIDANVDGLMKLTMLD